MPKLNQIIAIEKGVKTRAYAKLTEDHKALLKEDLFKGHAKTYVPKDADPTLPTGEVLPPDTKKVQLKADEIIKEVARSMAELFDVAATRDFGNCEARADLVVDGTVLIKDCPVTYFLFLEKQLADLHTFFAKLPVLDSGDSWSYDAGQDVYATRPVGTVRTKKLTRPLVLYPHTTEHPAQVKEVTEDVLAGTWTTIKYSSALPASRVNELVRRIEAIQKAVKFAREAANGIEVKEQHVGKAIFDFLLAGGPSGR